MTEKEIIKDEFMEKADKILLDIYYGEFVVIDGLNQHEEGLSFEEWLKK